MPSLKKTVNIKPLFFANSLLFRKWLEKNYNQKDELLVGYYKVDSGKASMTWGESVDQALCFGWIDGVRKSIDNISYSVRFTPRRSTSIWSAVNIKKIAELTKKGLMHQSGIDVYNSQLKNRSNVYSYENKKSNFPLKFEKLFKQNKNAWKYFQELAPSYQKTSIFWVTSAKQEETQLKRLIALISDSERGTNQWKNNKYKK